MRRIGVGDVAFDVLGSRFGQESDGDEKMADVIHETNSGAYRSRSLSETRFRGNE